MSIVLFFLALLFPGGDLSPSIEGVFVKNGQYYSQGLNVDSEQISISGIAFTNGVLTRESMLILDSLLAKLPLTKIDHIVVKSYGTGNDDNSLLKSRQRNAQSVVDYLVLSGKIDFRKLRAFNYHYEWEPGNFDRAKQYAADLEADRKKLVSLIVFLRQ